MIFLGVISRDQQWRLLHCQDHLGLASRIARLACRHEGDLQRVRAGTQQRPCHGCIDKGSFNLHPGIGLGQGVELRPREAFPVDDRGRLGPAQQSMPLGDRQHPAGITAQELDVVVVAADPRGGDGVAAWSAVLGSLSRCHHCAGQVGWSFAVHKAVQAQDKVRVILAKHTLNTLSLDRQLGTVHHERHLQRHRNPAIGIVRRERRLKHVLPRTEDRPGHSLKGERPGHFR